MGSTISPRSSFSNSAVKPYSLLGMYPWSWWSLAYIFFPLFRFILSIWYHFSKLSFQYQVLLLPFQLLPGWWHLQICYQYFPFYFPSHLENESWVLFPASSLPKPLGKLLTLFPCSVGGMKSSGMWQTSRPCGTEPPGELPTWEELSGEPQVLSLQHLTPAPSFLWALYSTDWAAATHLFWYKLQALVCFIPWHKSLKH